MPSSRPISAATAVLAIAVAALLLAACGGGGGESSAATGETGSVEAQLQEAVGTAGASCTETAEAISVEAARKTAESACTSIQGTVEKEVASISSSARGDANEAFEELVSKCESAASELSFGEGAALKLCEEFAQLKGGE